MAQAVRENSAATAMAFSLPPGLDTTGATSSNANGSIESMDTPEQEALLAEVRRLVLEDIDTKVGDKMKDIWSKGNKMLKAAEQERQLKNSEILAELTMCRAKQDSLQAENDQLRTAIAGMVQHLNMLGTIFSNAKAAPAGLATPGAANGDSSAASAASVHGSPPCTPAAPGLEAGSFPPLPSVPDFPYSPALTATPSAPAATPLSLAEALISDPPASPYPVSLMGSLTQTPLGQKIFSFTLRKADGTDLGLNVSHHEEDKCLRVESVRPEGAVEAWNRQCLGSAASEKAVLPGDRIISVNSISSDPIKMLEECRDSQLLKLTVVRGEAAKTTTLRADASEFVPAGVPAGLEAATDVEPAKEAEVKEENA